jgi:hypothetical protein
VASPASWRSTAGAILLAGALVPPTTRAEPQSERLAAYLDVIRQYRTGDPQAAATELGRWGRGDLRRTVEDLASHPERIDLCEGTGGAVALVEVEAAALLHTRVAARIPVDGDGADLEHLREARRLVDLAHSVASDREGGSIHPVAGRGCDVTLRVSRRDFYAATTGLLLRRGQTRLAMQAADRGLDLAPDDAWLLMAAASAHEQRALIEARDLGAPLFAPASPADRMRGDRERGDQVRTIEEETARADELLRRALVIQPDLAPARLRLGRLLAQKGDPEQAERELLVASRGNDAESRYLAELFLGRLGELRSDLEGAESHYRLALAAHPQSQAARLALAQVLGLAGRSEAARSLVLETLNAAWPRDPGADPWWQYAFGPWPEAERLFVAMDEAVRAP